MKLSISMRALALVLFMGMVSTIPCSYATPLADIRYQETDLGGGIWRYDYVLSNVADAGSGCDLYDVSIYFDPSAVFTGISLPNEWSSIEGAGFSEVFSMNPGAPPIGSDIAPGTSLGGFSFQIDYRLGNANFEAYLTNPIDPPNPVLYSDNTAPINNLTPVPEPGTIVLLSSGLAWLGSFKKIRGFHK